MDVVVAYTRGNPGICLKGLRKPMKTITGVNFENENSRMRSKNANPSIGYKKFWLEYLK